MHSDRTNSSSSHHVNSHATPVRRRRLALAASVALAAILLSLPASDDAAAASFRQHMGQMRTNVASHSRTLVHSFRPLKSAHLSRTAGHGRKPGKHKIVVGSNSSTTGRTPPGTGKPGTDGGTKTGGGDRRPPRWPHRPHWPIIPIGPGGTGVVVTDPVDGPPNVPPNNLTGGGQPPSNFSGNQAVTKRTGSGVPPANERRYVPDEVVVEVIGNFSEQAAAALALRHRLARLQTVDLALTGTKIFRWRIPDRRSVPQVVRALEADGAVLSAQPNYIATLMDSAATLVADPSQYAPAKLNAPQAHELSTGNHVLVAVVDSGIDIDHPELAGAIAGSFDAVEEALRARPLAGKAAAEAAAKLHSHGTGIAGAIVGHAKMMGIAPAAKILAIRSFAPNKSNSEGTTVSIQEGINWAVTHGARVINMSFAGPDDPGIARSLAAAHEHGIILVAASGNNGPNAQPQYPAANPNVIAVTATDADDHLFKAAVRGKHIAVAAPGVEIYLPSTGGTYQIVSGTSFSAAEVTGAVALLLERRPDLDPQSVRQALMSTARDLGPKGIDPQFGAGLVDSYRAVLSVIPAAGAAVAKSAAEASAQVIPAADHR